jgi:hypothetical protein
MLKRWTYVKRTAAIIAIVSCIIEEQYVEFGEAYAIKPLVVFLLHSYHLLLEFLQLLSKLRRLYVVDRQTEEVIECG